MESNKRKINVFGDIQNIDSAKIRVGRGLDCVLGLLAAMQKDEKVPAESKLLADFMRSKERRFNFITPTSESGEGKGKDLYNTVIRLKDEDQNFDLISSDNVAALEFFLDKYYDTGLMEDYIKHIDKGGDY